MEVTIDISKIDNLHCGLGQFSLHLSKHLEAIDPHLKFYAKKENLVGKRTLIKKKWHRSLFFQPSTAIWHATHQDVDVFPWSKKIKKVLTIHDLNALSELSCEKKKKKYLAQLQKKIDAAALITCISDFTKKEVLKHLEVNPDKIMRIYNGACLDDKIPPQKPPTLKFPSKKYIFGLGTISPKKNYDLVLKIAQKTDYCFVIAGSIFDRYGRELQKQIQHLGLANQVQFIGPVEEAEKNYLFTHAQLFFHPSFLEGFGLPVIEAMSFGLPVVTSNACSLPEISGDLGNTFNPHDPEDAISQIEKALIAPMPPEKYREHAHSFSWARSAKNYYQAYKSLT